MLKHKIVIYYRDQLVSSLAIMTLKTARQMDRIYTKSVLFLSFIPPLDTGTFAGRIVPGTMGFPRGNSSPMEVTLKSGSRNSKSELEM